MENKSASSKDSKNSAIILENKSQSLESVRQLSCKSMEQNYFSFVEEFTRRNISTYSHSSNYLPREKKPQSSKSLFTYVKDEFSLFDRYSITSQTTKPLIKLSCFNPAKLSKFGSAKETKVVEPLLDKPSYKFGKPGWFCCQCDNFNYKMRKKCNKCDKQRQLQPNFTKHEEKIDFEENLADKTNQNNWLCVSCGFSNFSYMKKCFQCTQ